MIPTIGVMMGAYIFARLLEMTLHKDNNALVKLVAVIAMLVDIVCVLGLVSQGSSLPAGLR